MKVHLELVRVLSGIRKWISQKFQKSVYNNVPYPNADDIWVRYSIIMLDMVHILLSECYDYKTLE